MKKRQDRNPTKANYRRGCFGSPFGRRESLLRIELHREAREKAIKELTKRVREEKIKPKNERELSVLLREYTEQKFKHLLEKRKNELRVARS